jgi:hypothetical protein
MTLTTDLENRLRKTGFEKRALENGLWKTGLENKTDSKIKKPGSAGLVDEWLSQSAHFASLAI